MVKIKAFIIFLLQFIDGPFVNYICESIIYHKFKFYFIGKIMTHKKIV